MPASFAFDVMTGVASMASPGEQAVGGPFSDVEAVSGEIASRGLASVRTASKSKKKPLSWK